MFLRNWWSNSILNTEDTELFRVVTFLNYTRDTMVYLSTFMLKFLHLPLFFQI